MNVLQSRRLVLPPQVQLLVAHWPKMEAGSCARPSESVLSTLRCVDVGVEFAELRIVSILASFWVPFDSRSGVVIYDYHGDSIVNWI